MSGALRKTMVYLGLAEDQSQYSQYSDYDDYGHEEHDGGARAEVTPIDQHRPVARVVRAHEPSAIARITTIHPRTYNEAKTIGENFREGVPVIMNLTDMDDSDAKRLVDFAAGLVFGLHGAIERVTSKVFLLSPETVEVNAEEHAPAAPARPLFNQS